MQLHQFLTLLATLALSGWVSALLVQIIKRSKWPSWLKLALSFVMAAAVGLASAWLSGDVTHFVSLWGHLTAEQVMTFATLIWIAAATWYRFYFKDATWAKKLGEWPRA